MLQAPLLYSLVETPYAPNIVVTLKCVFSRARFKRAEDESMRAIAWNNALYESNTTAARERSCLCLYIVPLDSRFQEVMFCISSCRRRRMETEAKAKVVAPVWGATFIQCLATLAVLPRSIWKKGWIHPILPNRPRHRLKSTPNFQPCPLNVAFLTTWKRGQLEDW